MLGLLLKVSTFTYREFAVKTEISKSFIFSQQKPFGETFSKITIKVSEEFSFSRKPAKSEMLPHAINNEINNEILRNFDGKKSRLGTWNFRRIIIPQKSSTVAVHHIKNSSLGN